MYCDCRQMGFSRYQSDAAQSLMVTLYMFWSVSATLTEEGRRVTTMAIPSSSTVVPSVRNTLGFDCLPSGTAPACLAAGSKARRISDSIQSVIVYYSQFLLDFQ